MAHNGLTAFRRLGFCVRRLISLLLGVALVAGLVAAAPAGANAEGSKIVSGWLPYWMTTPKSPAGVTSAVNNADLISTVSPFWYSATAGGPAGVQVGLNRNFTNGQANVDWAMAQLRGAGLKVIPAIADGSGKGRMAATLADPAKRALHIADLVNLAVSRNYDGIDLDYEIFAFTDGRDSWAATQPNWTAFVTELGAALRANGKQLSVTIPPPCTTANVCGPNSGYWVYNMGGIAPAVDRIRIMAYDFSVHAIGPIAPLPWVRSIVAYSAPVVTPGKLEIGVPTYGRAWTKKNANGSFQLSGTCPTSGPVFQALTARASVTDANIASTLAQNNVDPSTVQWDATAAESWVEYDKSSTWTDASGATQTCTARRIMWWVGPQAVLVRTQLVGEFGLAGAALWTIGGEAPDQWPLLRGYAAASNPVSTTVAATIPTTAIFGQPLPITASVTSNGVPVTGVEAVLQTKRATQKQWTAIATAPLGPDGAVAFSPPADRPGSWRVFVPGAPGRAEQASTPVPVVVSAAVKATTKTASARPGARVTVRVVSQPARAGQRVVVQVKKAGAWIALASGRTDARGVARVKVTLPKGTGDRALRALARRGAGFAQGVSPEFVIAAR